MKKILIVLAGLFISANLFADVYDDMAQKLSGYAKEDIKKIAIIPFSYTDNTSMTKDGSVISERLSVKLINLGRFEVIERSQLDKVLSELKLQASGTIDASSAKELGKVLGVDAIITGTLIQTADGKIEVNARIIKTETAQAIGAVQEYVSKDWVGGETQVVQKPIEQPTYQPTQTQTSSYSSGSSNRYGFFEFIFGFSGSPKMNIKFKNNYSNINFDQLGIRVNPPLSNGPYSKIEYKDIESKPLGPIGIRFGGFGRNGVVGGDFEFSFAKYKFDSQIFDAKMEGGSSNKAKISINNDEYLSAKSIIFSGDLLFRVPGKIVYPYCGLGFGFSLNFISMPYVTSYNSSSTDDVGLGLLIRLPVGLRFNLGEKTSAFIEARYESHGMYFDRSLKNENDSITVTGMRYILGIGSKF